MPSMLTSSVPAFGGDGLIDPPARPRPERVLAELHVCPAVECAGRTELEVLAHRKRLSPPGQSENIMAL